MNTTELFKQRKAVDLPSDSVRSLAMAAAAKGISLKKYLENVLLEQAKAIDAALNNPSPSGDPFFSDERNINRILQASEQAKAGKVTTISGKDELFRLLEGL